MRICTEAHKEQVDKAGNPYILHPLRVAAAGSDLDQAVLGLLHGVVEDNPRFTLDYIRENGFPEKIVIALDAITKRKKETLESYYYRAAQDNIAVMVKFHDLDDNSNPKRLELLDDDLALYFKRKYSNAKSLLGKFILERSRKQEADNERAANN